MLIIMVIVIWRSHEKKRLALVVSPRGCLGEALGAAWDVVGGELSLEIERGAFDMVLTVFFLIWRAFTDAMVSQILLITARLFFFDNFYTTLSS
jgi:hypothetical protein